VTGGWATFGGRGYELALLKDSLMADAGRPWIVMVEGEPGIGKRALLRPHPGCRGVSPAEKRWNARGADE